MDLDQVLVELHAQLELLDATILSMERLARLDRRPQRRRGGRWTMEPTRRHRNRPRSKPPKAMAAGSELRREFPNHA